MSKHEYISRYLLIINYLKRGQASWDDILHHLERQSEITGYNYLISQRTFQRDISEIRTLWNYDIQNNKSTGYYSLVQDEEENENAHLLDSFNLFNALSLTNNYSDFIRFESRTPKGTEHIYGLLHAIKNKLEVEIEYHKFYEEKSEKVLIQPYLIKQFKGRWYLLGIKSKTGELRTYGLDRIIGLNIAKKKITHSKNVDITNYFKNSFGIITPEDDKVERIVFTLDNFQGKYLKNYPLHHSQKPVKETKDSTTFEIHVRITYDLIMELLSYGEELTVLTPTNLIRELKRNYKNSLKKY